MKKNDFADYICHPFCTFYRPGVKEDLACRGAELIELLIREKGLNPETFTLIDKKTLPFPGQDPALEAVVCDPCPFKSEDCDFKSPAPPEDCEPCGGLVLLFRLKDQGIISLQNLIELNHAHE